jgi:glycosyltransferase involved in cell wall biosynthesis
MKTLVIFFPSIESAGVEKNFYYLINNLSSNFERVIVITSSKIKKKIFPKKVEFLNQYSSFWWNKNRFIRSIICFFLALKLFKKKNILILSFQSNIISIIISVILRCKIIIRLNTSPEKYINTIIKKNFFYFFYKFSDEIIVNSFEFKRRLKKILNLNSSVIYNPIGLPKKFRKKKINFFNQFKNLKIISIGRLTDQKDHLTLIKALHLLKKESIKFKVYLIGQGSNYNKIYNSIKKYKLTNIVKLAGFKEKAYEYINSADLFILTSKYEGLPNVLLEAQYLGIPIISSDCPTGPKEILMNGKAGTLFKTGNYFDLSNKIKSFIRNKYLFINQVKFAKKNLNRFENNIFLKKYNKILIKNFNEKIDK